MESVEESESTERVSSSWPLADLELDRKMGDMGKWGYLQDTRRVPCPVVMSDEVICEEVICEDVICEDDVRVEDDVGVDDVGVEDDGESAEREAWVEKIR